MNATSALFPHLDPDASWTIQQEAGDRLRAIYSAGARKRQAAVIGGHNVHLGGRTVRMSGQKHYLIGIDNDFMMGRALVVHRAMARTYPRDRRHHVENALRLRNALCWWGLDPAMRKG